MKYLLAAAFTLVVPALPAEVDLPECHVQRSALVAFSSPKAHDTLSISIQGAPCYNGTAIITIKSKTGAVLYRHQQPFKQLTATQWDDPELDRDAESFVKWTVEKGMNLVSELPSWAEPEAFYEENSTSIAISREEYERLRTLKQPIFYHQTYYEGGRHLVYDPTTKKTVVALEGGL